MATSKVLYPARVDLTVTNLQSLATNTTASSFLVGWSSQLIDNSANLDIEVQLSGYLTIGATAPAASNSGITVYAFAPTGWSGSAYTYPVTTAGALGTEGNGVTFASANVQNAGLVFLANLFIDATANRRYDIRPLPVAQAFGGSLPKYYGFFIATQVNTVACPLAATGNSLILERIQYQSI